MKKTIHLLGLAAALVALAACQREPVNGSENYDEGNSVNVKFVLNVSTETGKDTKTTAEYAQVGGSFLGMDQVHLLAYNLDDHNKGTGGAASQGHFFYNPIIKEGTGEEVTYKIVSASRDFSMGTLFNKGAVTSDKSSRTIELAIPLGTNSLSLYGKATKTADSDYQGSTIAAGDPSDLRTLTFTLESRLTSKDRYNVGAFFFSTMLTHFMTSGLVNENTFWSEPIGNVDRSYCFWYPVPSPDVTKDFPKNPEDQDTKTIGEGTSAVTYTYYKSYGFWYPVTGTGTATGFPANPEDQDTKTINGVTYTFRKGQLSWKQLGTMHLYQIDGKGVDPNEFVKTAGSESQGKDGVYYQVNPLGEALGQAYYAICAVQQKGTLQELRAGSASAMLRICEDMYSIMEKNVAASPMSWEEVCAQKLASLIKERMEKYFERSSTSGFNFIKTDGGGIDIASLKTAAESSCTSSKWEANKTLFLDNFDVSYFYNVPAGYYGFPQNVGLPYGAAIMQCTPDWSDQKKIDAFNYTDKIPAYGMGGSYFPIENYRFPPELMYYGNSSLRVTNSEVAENQFPTSATNWGKDESWDSKWEENGSVKTTTRTVAMKNTINYGTALLRSTVRYADGLKALKDNNAALHPGEQDNSISIEDTSAGFLVTGIIIGGQADVMGWNFTRYPDDKDQYKVMGWNSTDKKYTGLTFTNNPFDKMIYDRVVNGYVIGQATTPIYSMVWDNYDATKPADDQSDVYIAVELLNQTGKDFWGELNMIRKNGVFYLVGKLDLSTAIAAARATSSSAFTNLARSDYNYPPFLPDTGETVNAPRVFMQDYVTEATLLLKEDALKHAYLTVPDLRASQVSLGLSIDLAWKPGLAFTVEMGVLD